MMAFGIAGVSVLIVIQMRRTEAALAALIVSVSAEQVAKHQLHVSRLNLIEPQIQALGDLFVSQRNLNEQQTALNNAFIQKITRYDSFLGTETPPPVKVQ